MAFDTTPPPLGFGAGERFTSPLRIYYYEGWLYLFDAQGYLCRVIVEHTLDLQVQQLLEAEAQPSPDPARKFYRPGARELVFPGSALEREAKSLALAERAKDPAKFTGTTPKAELSAKALADLEKSLGL